MTDSILLKTALDKAMAICSRREICISEIESRLDSWGIDTTDHLKIINTLISENFINEDRYAKAFVKDRFKYNKWGKVKITAHLRAKKIQPEIISSALETIDDETYLHVLKELLSLRRRSVRAKNMYDLKAKLLRFGLSKGFESSLLYSLLNEIAPE